MLCSEMLLCGDAYDLWPTTQLDHSPNADRGCGRVDEREHGGQHPRSSSIGSTDSYYPSRPLLH